MGPAPADFPRRASQCPYNGAMMNVALIPVRKIVLMIVSAIAALGTNAVLAGGLESVQKIPVSSLRSEIEAVDPGTDFDGQTVDVWFENLGGCDGNSDLGGNLTHFYFETERQDHVPHRIDIFCRGWDDGTFSAALIDTSIAGLFVYSGDLGNAAFQKEFGDCPAPTWVRRYDTEFGDYRVDLGFRNQKVISVLYVYPGRGQMIAGVITPDRGWTGVRAVHLQIWRRDTGRSSRFLLVVSKESENRSVDVLEVESQIARFGRESAPRTGSAGAKNQTENATGVLDEVREIVEQGNGVVEIFRSPGFHLHGQ